MFDWMSFFLRQKCILSDYSCLDILLLLLLFIRFICFPKSTVFIYKKKTHGLDDSLFYFTAELRLFKIVIFDCRKSPFLKSAIGSSNTTREVIIIDDVCRSQKCLVTEPTIRDYPITIYFLSRVHA